MRIIIAEAGVEYKTASERKICSPADVTGAMADMTGSLTEQFCALYLNTKNGLIAAEILTSGLVGECSVHPREVFRPAILRAAAAVILVHNHPSGDSQPSSEDLKITRQLVEAGKVIGIKVLDHIILGDGKFLSMREEGLVEF